MIRTSAIVSLIVSATGAAAADFSAEGTGFGTTSSTPMPVSADVTVIQTESNFDRFEMQEPDNPLAGMTGPCFGSILMNAGEITGQGNCLYTDSDGDNVVMEWTAQGMSPEGQTMGTWSIVTGTGKWDGSSGGGDFSAGTGADGTYSNATTGSFSMP